MRGPNGPNKEDVSISVVIIYTQMNAVKWIREWMTDDKMTIIFSPDLTQCNYQASAYKQAKNDTKQNQTKKEMKKIKKMNVLCLCNRHAACVQIISFPICLSLRVARFSLYMFFFIMFGFIFNHRERLSYHL